MEENKFSGGNWREGPPGTVVTDDATGFPPNTGHSGDEAFKYYGGNLIAESIAKHSDAKLIVLSPALYNAIRKCQDILAKGVPSGSAVSDKEMLSEILGVLDAQELVKKMSDVNA